MRLAARSRMWRRRVLVIEGPFERGVFCVTESRLASETRYSVHLTQSITKMTKLICVGFLVLTAGSRCFGQPFHREDNPMKYALIHHEPVNERWTLDHTAKQYTND